jgi:hypothetical protein
MHSAKLNSAKLNTVDIFARLVVFGGAFYLSLRIGLGLLVS